MDHCFHQFIVLFCFVVSNSILYCTVVVMCVYCVVFIVCVCYIFACVAMYVAPVGREEWHLPTAGKSNQ